jgi:hypothetical protein
MFDSLDGENFIIVAVAEESRGAEQARPWIEQAQTTYLNLIDVEHRVASLYGMVNVPQCVWIDEAGRIVRPPETAGSTDHFRSMDRTTRTLAPELAAARAQARTDYVQAVRDWVRTGRHALPQDAARSKLPRITPEIALAHAHFRMGVWLRRHDRGEEAGQHFAEASRLHPDSWNMWRQAADLDEVGGAGGAAFWARVQALGERPYYPPPEL